MQVLVMVPSNRATQTIALCVSIYTRLYSSEPLLSLTNSLKMAAHCFHVSAVCVVCVCAFGYIAAVLVQLVQSSNVNLEGRAPAIVHTHKHVISFSFNSSLS